MLFLSFLEGFKQHIRYASTMEILISIFLTIQPFVRQYPEKFRVIVLIALNND